MSKLGIIKTYLTTDDQLQYDDESLWESIKQSVVNSLEGHQYETN